MRNTKTGEDLAPLSFTDEKIPGLGVVEPSTPFEALQARIEFDLAAHNVPSRRITQAAE